MREGERDEFTHWMETGWGHEVDITIDELYEKEVPDLVEYLSQEDRQYGEGRIDLFRVGCKDNREKAIEVLNHLADKGNSVLIIEHNLDVIKSADWIIDLGPEGGSGGGEVIAEGTPTDVMKVKKGYTGQYLKNM